jgi:hypothetical protein
MHNYCSTLIFFSCSELDSSNFPFRKPNRQPIAALAVDITAAKTMAAPWWEQSAAPGSEQQGKYFYRWC